eukprot:s1906_g6.t2
MASHLVKGALVHLSGPQEEVLELYVSGEPSLEALGSVSVEGGAQLQRFDRASQRWLALTFDGRLVSTTPDLSQLRPLEVQDLGIDFVVGPSSNREVLAEAMANKLFLDGFCVSQTLDKRTEISEMLTATEAHVSFSRIPAEFEPYYMGLESKERHALIDFEECSDELTRIFSDADTRLTRLGDSVSVALREKLGTRITGRTNLMVRQTFSNSDEEANCKPVDHPGSSEREMFMSLVKRRRVCVMHFLGPRTGKLKLISRHGGQEVEIEASPGKMVLFMTERFQYSHTCEGRTTTLQTWLLGQRPEYYMQSFGGDLSVLAPIAERGIDPPKGEGVVVTGVATQIGGDSKDHKCYWLMFNKAGTDTAVSTPITRYDISDYCFDGSMQEAQQAGKSYTPHQGYVDGIEFFDAKFFGISSMEAESMDPNQRKTLEVSYEVVNMAGYDLPSLQKSSKNIGVFVGVSGSEWGTVPHKMDAAGCGSAEAIISNRVNFALNLKGASQTINTACSSGLVEAVWIWHYGGPSAPRRWHAHCPGPVQNADVEQLSEEQLEAQIWEKEKELKDTGRFRFPCEVDLRQQLAALRATAERNASNEEVEEEDDEQEQLSLDAAVRSYEKAAGLLRYVECLRQDWKNDDGSYKGIEDDFLHVDETALEAAEASELVQSCYLNIALACQKLRKFDDMKRACDEVLEKVNPDSVKALYRRAQARLAPISAKDTDREAAIQEADLMAAARLAPNDKEASIPELRAFAVAFLAEKSVRRKPRCSTCASGHKAFHGGEAAAPTDTVLQEMEDKSTFGGLFQRGEVVKNDYKSEPPRPAAPAKWDLNDPKATHTGKVHLKYKDFDPLDGTICCGTQLAYGPFGFVGCCSGGMLSFKGRCFTYDVSADGYLRGEGVSSIFLELKEFGREVFTLMPASQANQDGRSASITAPNGPSQERCIRACFREAKYQPAEVDCFETHGTGTALGDPIEVGAFKRIYAQSQRAHPLMVTSSKTNLGHLEGGAGMAGFIKCILQVMRCEASPNIHLRERNPHLDVEGFPTQFLSEGLVTHYNTAVTGVSSFGFGGTNAHAMAFGQNCVTARDVTKKDFRGLMLQKIMQETHVVLRAASTVGGPGGPGEQRIQRRKKGASELSPILAEVETEPEAQDILDQARPEDLLEVSASDEGSGLKAGPLAKKMWSCARRGVRSEEVWARFAQRVLMTGTLIGATDISLMFRAFARIKYRDARALDTLSPFILRHIDSFNTEELVLLLLAHKKLEYERTDNLHLLLNVLCQRREEWTGKDVALISNAVAHFYIYRPRFWRLAAMSLNRLVWTMNPLELTILVSAMARVDRRDEQALIVIAKMCRRCAQRHLFSQETLATAMNAFAKLDFNNVKLAKAFEDAAVKKLDRALELGPQYRRSGSLRDQDVFDLQALVLLFRTLVALVGTSDDVAEKLLTLLAWSKDELGDYQRRVLKPTSVAFRRLHPVLFKSLSMECRDALHTFETTQVKISTFESRWMREVRGTLRKMDVSVELKPLIDDQVLDIWLPVSKAVVCAVGPYGYYAGTTERTAYSKLHQRTLEMEGYVCMTVPYFEWADLKTEEDKMVYLWSLGRKSAGTGKKGQALPPDVFKHSLDPEEWETNGAPLSEDKIGKVYEVEVDASGAAVWREVVDTPPDPKAHKRFGLAGSFNGWSCTTMAELPGLPGLFAAEITVGESGVEYFHVLGDEDTSQVYYPAQPRSRRKIPQLRGTVVQAGPGMAVTLIFEEKSVVFGWTEGTAAKEFGTQLRSAWRLDRSERTSSEREGCLSSLAELEILADRASEADPPVRITPRDIFERRYPEAAQHRFRIACRAELASDISAPKVGAEASPGPGGYSPEPRAEKLLLPPQRKCPSGAKFQKAGGSQLQFLQMLEGNKNPKAQLEEGTVLTAEEVARHNQVGDCWTIFQGRVYDISAYIDFHPGGKKQIMQGAGKDMTSLFHKAHPWVSMEGLVGKLCLGPLVAKPMAKTHSQPTVAKATPSYYNAVTEAVSL